MKTLHRTLFASVLPLFLVACGIDEPIATQTVSTDGSGGSSPAATGGTGGDGDTQGGTGGADSGTGGATGGNEATGGTDASGGAAGAGSDLLIDDFEDGDNRSLVEGWWYQYDDQSNGGGSELTIPMKDGQIAAEGEGYESERSLLTEFTFDQGTLSYEPYVGFGCTLPTPAEALGLTNYAGLRYMYRGAAHEVRIQTAEVEDYDFFAVQLPASSNWRAAELPYDLFIQGGWGEKVDFVLDSATDISWHIRGTTGQSGSLLIDDVTFVRDIETQSVPDLDIREPSPPADVELPTVEIDNPLQAHALASLDKGCNIDSWLEAGPFDGFAPYDEVFVERLAAAGFRSLRLPIDFDLFVEERTVEGDAVNLTVSDDLFTVLDSFDAWTTEYGLSLTIDYHQYDRSLDFADEVSMTEVIELWSMVAEHFASNTRDDLFYELLNEPELSVDGTAPTGTQWGDFAAEIVDAIRDHDDTHTILFGDVDWYGIDALVARTPLDDDNIVYVFHFYDPFIFTHQGASWADMSATHDIPYPYSTERWSEYSSEFGFSDLNPSWQWSSLQYYYHDGTKAALRNRIAQAKQWAVEHQVPVICNEFGAYDRSSRKEDRVRYYTDLADIFAELEIPWQIWFQLMDPETGEMDEEYRTALGLDE